MRYPVDDLTSSVILSQTRPSGGNLPVRYVFLMLPALLPDDQIVTRPVAISAMTSTARPGACREAFHPGAMQHPRQPTKLNQKQAPLI